MAVDLNGNFVAEEQPLSGITVPQAPTVTAPTAASVYSAPNIQQATTAPVAQPDLSDPLGIYDFYLKGADVTQTQGQFQSDQAALAKAKATARSRQLAIEQNPLESQQFIVGQQSRAGQLDAATLSALSDAAGVSQSAYLASKEDAQNKANLALGQRDQLTNLIVNNPGAKIKYTDTFEEAVGKAQKYSVKKAKEDAKKAEKADLKATAKALGIKTSGLSRREIERKLSKYAKKESAKQDEIDAIDLALKKKTLNKPYYAPKDGDSLKNSYTSTEQNRFIEEALAGGEDWNDIKQTFIGLGIPVDEGSNMDTYLKNKFGY